MEQHQSDQSGGSNKSSASDRKRVRKLTKKQPDELLEQITTKSNAVAQTPRNQNRIQKQT